MRILIINTWYYPNLKGGSEQSSKLLAEWLAKKGHDVAVFSADALNSETTERIGDITVYRCKSYITKECNGILSKIKSKLQGINYRPAKQSLLDVIKAFRPDIVHTNSMGGISFSAWETISKCGIPIVHTLRDYSVCSPRGVYESVNSTKFPYNAFLYYHQSRSKKYSQNIDYVTAPSAYTLDAISKMGYFENTPRRCIVNSVDMDIEETKQCIKSRLNRATGQKNFLFVGRLIKIKGIIPLLEAISQVKKQEFNFIICGEGPLSELVQERARVDSRIKYLGHLSNEKLAEEYRKSHVVIVPSIWDEPFGRVIIEANKYGAPVIASKRGGIPEIVNTIGGGVLLDEITPESLAETITKFGNQNLSKFYDNILNNIEKYSLQTQIDSFEQVYKEILKGTYKE